MGQLLEMSVRDTVKEAFDCAGVTVYLVQIDCMLVSNKQFLIPHLHPYITPFSLKIPDKADPLHFPISPKNL